MMTNMVPWKIEDGVATWETKWGTVKLDAEDVDKFLLGSLHVINRNPNARKPDPRLNVNLPKSSKPRLLRDVARFLLSPPVGMVVDHDNRQTLDNRKTNLRTCSKTQNNFNRSATKGRDLPKGVSEHRKRFRATIGVNYKLIRLGTFDTPQEASSAYMTAANRIAGDFAHDGHNERKAESGNA